MASFNTFATLAIAFFEKLHQSFPPAGEWEGGFLAGRFLNADPVRQNAGFTQNYNRYSYCLNNPLKYTDPTGNQIYNCGIMEGITGFSFTGGGGGGGSITPHIDSWYADGSMPGSYSYTDYTGDYTDYFGNRVPFNDVFNNYLKPNGASLPSNTDLGSISFGHRNGVNGVWYQTVNIQGSYTNWADGINTPGSQINVINKFTAIVGGYVLKYNGKRLSVDINGEVYSTIASSGKGVHMNNPSAQNISNKGPIQEGTYFFKNSQWNSQSKIRQIYNIIRGNGDWGDYNVPLTPIGDRTRNRFYLHGGFFEGSAGCIDAGSNIGLIYYLLRNQQITYLEVNY